MKLLVLMSLLSLVYSERPKFSDDRGQFNENGFTFKHNNKEGSKVGGISFFFQKRRSTEESGCVILGLSIQLELTNWYKFGLFLGDLTFTQDLFMISYLPFPLIPGLSYHFVSATFDSTKVLN